MLATICTFVSEARDLARGHRRTWVHIEGGGITKRPTRPTWGQTTIGMAGASASVSPISSDSCALTRSAGIRWSHGQSDTGPQAPETVVSECMKLSLGVPPHKPVTRNTLFLSGGGISAPKGGRDERSRSRCGVPGASLPPQAAAIDGKTDGEAAHQRQPGHIKNKTEQHVI